MGVVDLGEELNEGTNRRVLPLFVSDWSRIFCGGKSSVSSSRQTTIIRVGHVETRVSARPTETERGREIYIYRYIWRERERENRIDREMEKGIKSQTIYNLLTGEGSHQLYPKIKQQQPGLFLI